MYYRQRTEHTERGLTMTNEVIKKMLQDGYNKVAFTDKYILGWIIDHVVYMAICNRELVDRVTCLDMASRGAGYALRFKPNRSQKMLLMTAGVECLCSEKFFNDMVAESRYNRGEIFEKLVTEKFGQVWEKDTVPFTKAGDIEVNGIAYQIKFEKATFTNEKALASLMK